MRRGSRRVQLLDYKTGEFMVDPADDTAGDHIEFILEVGLVVATTARFALKSNEAGWFHANSILHLLENGYRSLQSVAIEVNTS